MTAIQTLKSGRASALKDVEKARKEHKKLQTKTEAIVKLFGESKVRLARAEAGLNALDDALKNMEGDTEKAPKAKATSVDAVKIDGRSKEARAAKAAVKAAGKAPKAKATSVGAVKIDGRTKEARAAKAAVKAAGKAPKAKAPKAKAVKAAPAKKTPKAAKISAKKTGKKGVSRQAAGRREVAEGKRPTIKDAIVQVMGNKVMSRHQVHDGLKAKGWLPRSNDTLGYVGYLLSATKAKDGGHLFERDEAKGRGFYRVRQDSLTSPETPKVEKAKKSEKAETAAAEPKAKRKYTKRAKPEAVAAPPKSEVNGTSKEKSADEILADAHLLDTAAPFGG
jgi:hypothetical protein